MRAGKSARVYSPSGKPFDLKHEEDQAYIINRNTLDTVMAGGMLLMMVQSTYMVVL